MERPTATSGVEQNSPIATPGKAKRALNYNHYVKELFGDHYGIDKFLSFSLQFSSISEDHAKQIKEFSELPKNIASYINDFDSTISEDAFNSPMYSYRVLYVPKSVNRKGQADRVIEFIKSDSPEAEGINKEYVLIKEKERKKYLASDVVKLMKKKGFAKFGMHQHTELWHKLDAKNPDNGFGVNVVKYWYWYDTWLSEVEKHCVENRDSLTE